MLINKILCQPEDTKYPIDFGKRSGDVFNALSARARKIVRPRCEFFYHDKPYKWYHGLLLGWWRFYKNESFYDKKSSAHLWDYNADDDDE